ncbi:MAG: SDR family oxidoreductase [Candidatus Aminicenantes bacterium]|nr:SDR family oxidoreductase [Candidatus Aminicenantes bacterium]
MRVLITGAAGFIGSHLVEKYLKEGWEVIGLDNFLTGKVDNIEEFFAHPNFTFIKYDVTNFLYVKGSLDLILHFACPASPLHYMKHKIHTMKVDSIGTLHALGLAKEKKARFVLASSSEVYGDPEITPQHEGYRGNVSPVGPRSVYDEAKRFSEALSMAYYREHGVDVRIARIFNTYGTKMAFDDGRVIPNFLKQAILGEPITVFGDGSQTRSFCYIKDMVEAIYKLSIKEGIAGEVVNLGNPDELTILKLAEIIKDLTGSSSVIKFLPLPEDDPKRRRPDISKAKRLLNWEPKYNLKEGLEEVIPWFKKRILKKE